MMDYWPKVSSNAAFGAVSMRLGPLGEGIVGITVTDLPMVGQVTLSNGTPVTRGQSLSAAELSGLIFDPLGAAGGRAVFSYETVDVIGNRVDAFVDLTVTGRLAGDALHFVATAPGTGSELRRLMPGDSVELVADFFAGAPGSGILFPVVLGDTLYLGPNAYDATGPGYGREPFAIGQDGVPHLIADIQPGATGSFPANFYEHENTVYFTATGPDVGQELYRALPAGGAELVADIYEGPTGSFPQLFTPFGDSVYFAARDELLQNELFRLTAGGAVELVADLNTQSNPPSSNPHEFTPYGDALYFSAWGDGDGYQLFRLAPDGAVTRITDSGTIRYNMDPTGLRVFNGQLYFMANESTGFTANFDLYRMGGDHALTKVWNGNLGGLGVWRDAVEFGGALYFSADTALPDGTDGGRELWRLWPDDRVELVRDINPGRAPSNPTGFTPFDGKLYFTANHALHGTELWAVDAAGVATMVADLVPGAGSGVAPGLHVLGGALYFAGGSAETGLELMRVLRDGSIETVADILPGPDGSAPQFFTTLLVDIAYTMPDGSPSNDVLLGGDADETAEAGEGDDYVNGQAGNDSLSGGAGNDQVLGDAGNDTLAGGDGADTLNGGDGDDVIFGGDTAADLRDVIFGGAGNDRIDAGHGNDQVYGGDGDDTVEGGFGVDEIIGQGGNDVLTGSAFSDLIFGGDGNDFINGGFGSDRVNGGAGADRFYHLGIADHGSDWIQDYDAAQGDRLVFGGVGMRSQFQVNLTETAGAGAAGIDEAFVIYRPTGQILWALVDGGAQGSINLQISGQVFDLLA